ncbi:hypothetical protein H0H92_003469 [Tricholoma furcatifolium]|nr:hypothetical protein H0H92_003469 [Tricholoma furcatifolium]
MYLPPTFLRGHETEDEGLLEAIIRWFEQLGAQIGSPTDIYKAFCYGEHTPANSVFILLQSTGTHYNAGTSDSRILLAIRLLAGAVGIYVFLAFIVS